MHFKVDNSGSMTWGSNLKIRDASDYMQNKYRLPPNTLLTRWQEAEDRLHIIVDLLAYVPTGQIKVSAFDRSTPGAYFILDRNGKTPEQFKDDAHNKIDLFFSQPPNGDTPILHNLQNMLAEGDCMRGGSSDLRTAYYILTDGEPNGQASEIAAIKNRLKDRPNSSINPVTFLACSNVPKDYKWMHEVDEVCCLKGNAGYVAAINAYNGQAEEVATNQGRTFPYTKGFWLLCTIAAAMNRDDLDALDGHVPLTKPILDELMGRILTEAEYGFYFNNHPHAGNNKNGVFRPDYELFVTSKNTNNIPSVQIFEGQLARELAKNMDEGDDDSEEREMECARQAVRNWRRANSPLNAGMFGETSARGVLNNKIDERCTVCAIL
jgi:hypothetical protein